MQNGKNQKSEQVGFDVDNVDMWTFLCVFTLIINILTPVHILSTSCPHLSTSVQHSAKCGQNVKEPNKKCPHVPACGQMWTHCGHAYKSLFSNWKHITLSTYLGVVHIFQKNSPAHTFLLALSGAIFTKAIFFSQFHNLVLCTTSNH